MSWKSERSSRKGKDFSSSSPLPFHLVEVQAARRATRAAEGEDDDDTITTEDGDKGDDTNPCDSII